MEPGSGHRATGSEDDGGRALHARLIRGDPTAPSDLANRYLEPLVDWLRRTFPRDDDALLETVAIELILKVGVRPEQYDPLRLPLPAYLRMAARADVLNAREREQRRARRIVPIEDVELHPPVRNTEWAHMADPADSVIEALDREKIVAMREQFDDRDWELVLLQMDRERRTEPFAVILGIQDQPWEEQARQVKRAKDRLKKRLQRLWRRMYGDG